MFRQIFSSPVAWSSPALRSVTRLCYFSTRTPAECPPIEIEGRRLPVTRARPEQTEEIFEFLLQNFFSVPPINYVYGYDPADPSKKPLWKLDQIRHCLSQPYSIVVRDPDSGNRMVGVCVNELERKDNKTASKHFDPKLMAVSPKKEVSKDRSPGWMAKALSSELYRGVDLFSKYETDRILHMYMVAAIPEYRTDTSQSGLVARMGSFTMQLAMEDGVEAVRIKIFLESAQKEATRLGYEVIKSIDFGAFEVDGEKPLSKLPGLVEGHRSAALMAWRTPNKPFLAKPFVESFYALPQVSGDFRRGTGFN